MRWDCKAKNPMDLGFSLLMGNINKTESREAAAKDDLDPIPKKYFCLYLTIILIFLSALIFFFFFLIKLKKRTHIEAEKLKKIFVIISTQISSQILNLKSHNILKQWK